MRLTKNDVGKYFMVFDETTNDREKTLFVVKFIQYRGDVYYKYTMDAVSGEDKGTRSIYCSGEVVREMTDVEALIYVL